MAAGFPHSRLSTPAQFECAPSGLERTMDAATLVPPSMFLPEEPLLLSSHDDPSSLSSKVQSSPQKSPKSERHLIFQESIDKPMQHSVATETLPGFQEDRLASGTEPSRHFDATNEGSNSLRDEFTTINKKLIGCLDTDNRVRRRSERLERELQEREDAMRFREVLGMREIGAVKDWYRTEIEKKERQLNEVLAQNREIQREKKVEKDEYNRKVREMLLDLRNKSLAVDRLEKEKLHLKTNIREAETSKETIIKDIEKEHLQILAELKQNSSQECNKLRFANDGLTSFTEDLKCQVKSVNNELTALKAELEDKNIVNTELEQAICQIKADAYTAVCEKEELLTLQDKDHKKELENRLEIYSEKHELYEAKLEAQRKESTIQCAKIKELSKELTEAQNVSESLRMYIGNNLSATNLEALQRESEEAQSEASSWKATCSSLQSSNDALNTRITSLMEVMRIQEKEISGGNGYSSSADKLLTKWRYKVYTLLVQQKSDQVTMKETVNSLNCKVEKCQRELEKVKDSKQLLAVHLQEKQAAVTELHNVVNCLKSSNVRLTDDVTSLSQENERYCKDIATLTDGLQGVWPMTKLFTENLEMSLSKLITLEKRAVFATERLKTIKDLFARKDNLRKQNTVSTIAEPQASCNKDVVVHLESEIEKLTEERTFLAAKLKNDAEVLETRIQSVRTEVKDELEKKSKEVSCLSVELAEIKVLNGSLSEQLDEKTRKHNDALEKIDMLQNNIAKETNLLNQEFQSQLEEERQKHSNSISQLNKIVEETRQEHAKVVVSVGHLERALEREKEKCTDRERLLQTEHELEMECLRKKLISCEKERNLLLTTVKQEGIGKKTARAKPHSISVEEPQVHTSHPSNNEIISVLKDLQELSSNLLSNDNDENT